MMSYIIALKVLIHQTATIASHYLMGIVLKKVPILQLQVIWAALLHTHL